MYVIFVKILFVCSKQQWKILKKVGGFFLRFHSVKCYDFLKVKKCIPFWWNKLGPNRNSNATSITINYHQPVVLQYEKLIQTSK